MNRARVAAAVGLGLGAAAVANQLIARRSERRRPPKGQFVLSEGLRLHFLERGSGSPVVLLHGNGATAEDFEISGLLDALAETHRVIAFDRPGFGYSERPRRKAWTPTAQARAVYGALRSLGVEKPLVVGHSWGALVALAMATEHPGELGGLALISGYYRPTARLDAPLLSGPAIPGFGAVMRHTISPLIGWLTAPLVFKALFSPAPVTKAFKARFPTGLALRPWQLRATAADTLYMVPAAAKAVLHYDDLELPILIIAGTGDRLVNYRRQAQWLSRTIPAADLLTLDGGHMIHHTRPDQVAFAIEMLARQVEAAGSVGSAVRAAVADPELSAASDPVA